MPNTYDNAKKQAALSKALTELAPFLINGERIRVHEGLPFGRGGFSVVRKATLSPDPSADEPGAPLEVAVKELILQSHSPTRIALRLAREIKIWSMLDHPNVLKFIGFHMGLSKERACLVCPFMRAGSLRNRLQSDDITIEDRYKWACGITEGLKYLHTMLPPVVHGDLKADNVLLGDDNEAVLCDFGVSSIVLEPHDESPPSGLSTSGEIKGSLRWYSPELFDEGASHTTASDIWAWALTVLEVLTGRIPYAKIGNQYGLIKHITMNQPPSPEDYPELGQASSFWSMVAHCWGKDPVSRPAIGECHHLVTESSVLSLALITIGLQQTAKYVRTMKICEAQSKAIYEQAMNISDTADRRYRSMVVRESITGEFRALGGFIMGLQGDINSINDNLKNLNKKPKYHMFVNFLGIRDLLGEHHDKLNTYSGMISAIASATDQQTAEEWSQQHVQKHDDAMEQDRQSLKVIEENASALEEQLEGCKRTWASYSTTEPREEQVREACLMLYRARHDISASDLVLPVATLDGEIERLGNEPIHRGSTLDIWKGRWLKEFDVVLKVYREIRDAFTDDEQSALKLQIDLWRTMKHPNVLTLIGVCTLEGYLSHHPSLHFALPWLPNRDAPQYLKKNPDADRMRMIHDVALGLKYLHSIDIMHGGLQGSNVLISENGSAVLSGISEMCDFREYYQEFEDTYMPLPYDVRWTAPEAVDTAEWTPCSDVYSFAMTSLQLLSDRIPYYNSNLAIGWLLVAIRSGAKKPAREDYPSKWIEDRMWSLLNKCWQTDPEERITIDEVLVEVDALRREQYGWDGTIIIQEGWSSKGVQLP